MRRHNQRIRARPELQQQRAADVALSMSWLDDMFSSNKDTQQRTAGARQSDTNSAEVQDAEIVEVRSLCLVAPWTSVLHRFVEVARCSSDCTASVQVMQ
jgi:hypothetical protein